MGLQNTGDDGGDGRQKPATGSYDEGAGVVVVAETLQLVSARCLRR